MNQDQIQIEPLPRTDIVVKAGRRYQIKVRGVHHADIFEVCAGFWLISEVGDSPIDCSGGAYSTLENAKAAARKIYADATDEYFVATDGKGGWMRVNGEYVDDKDWRHEYERRVCERVFKHSENYPLRSDYNMQAIGKKQGLYLADCAAAAHHAQQAGHNITFDVEVDKGSGRRTQSVFSRGCYVGFIFRSREDRYVGLQLDRLWRNRNGLSEFWADTDFDTFADARAAIIAALPKGDSQ